MEEARLKLVDLEKERNVMAAPLKRVPQLEAEVEDLENSITLQCSIHQAGVKGLHAAHKLKIERLNEARA